MSVYRRFYFFTMLYIDLDPVWGYRGSRFGAPSSFVGCVFVVVFSVGVSFSLQLWGCRVSNVRVRGRERFWARIREGTWGRRTQLCGMCCFMCSSGRGVRMNLVRLSSFGCRCVVEMIGGLCIWMKSLGRRVRYDCIWGEGARRSLRARVHQ